MSAFTRVSVGAGARPCTILYSSAILMSRRRSSSVSHPKSFIIFVTLLSRVESPVIPAVHYAPRRVAESRIRKIGVSACLRDVFAMFWNPSVSFLNTSGNLLGTSGSKKLRHPNFKSCKVWTPKDAEGLIREGFGILGKPSGTIRDVREPISINSASSENLLRGFVIVFLYISRCIFIHFSLKSTEKIKLSTKLHRVKIQVVIIMIIIRIIMLRTIIISIVIFIYY